MIGKVLEDLKLSKSDDDEDIVDVELIAPPLEA
jgi:hypothetical protein